MNRIHTLRDSCFNHEFKRSIYSFFFFGINILITCVCVINNSNNTILYRMGFYQNTAGNKLIINESTYG